jgi:hypothetical protein
MPVTELVRFDVPPISTNLMSVPEGPNCITNAFEPAVTTVLEVWVVFKELEFEVGSVVEIEFTLQYILDPIQPPQYIFPKLSGQSVGPLAFAAHAAFVF